MPNRCPQGHQLEEFITGHDWRCSQCRAEWLGGAKFGGCTRCKWDMCPACIAAPAARAGSALVARGSVAAAARASRAVGTTPKFGVMAPATPPRAPRPKPSVAPPRTPPTRYLAPDDADYYAPDDAPPEAPEQHSAPGGPSAVAARAPWQRGEPASSSGAQQAPWRQPAARTASPEEAPEEAAEEEEEDEAEAQQPQRKKRRGKPRCRPGSTERRLRKLEAALAREPYVDTGDA